MPLSNRLTNNGFEGIHIIIQQVGSSNHRAGWPVPARSYWLHRIGERAAHAALVIDKVNGIIIFHQYVAALEVAEHKVFVFRKSEVGAQGFKVINQLLLVIGLAQSIQEIVFEVQKIGHDGLFAKFLVGKAARIIEPFMSLYLQQGQLVKAVPEKGHTLHRKDLLLPSRLSKEDIAKIFLQVDGPVFIIAGICGTRQGSFS